MSNTLTAPLYQLADTFLQIADNLAATDLPAEVVADTLESVSGPFEEKALQVAMYVRNLESMADSISKVEQEMRARRDAKEKLAEKLRAYLKVQMERTGIKRIESPMLALRVQKNPASVDIFDAAQLPAQFMRTPRPPPPEPDKVAIRKALEAFEDVPGARLVQGSRVVIG